ncbi:MAG: translation initiation factor IF-2 [Eubacteriales bacterium]|nr:translation initiation factor IF-2 [Eubacteriales bacterium]
MAKVRVHELAKKVDQSTKDVIQALDKIGVEVKSALSAVDDKTAKKVESMFSPGNAGNGKKNMKQKDDEKKQDNRPKRKQVNFGAQRFGASSDERRPVRRPEGSRDGQRVNRDNAGRPRRDDARPATGQRGEKRRDTKSDGRRSENRNKPVQRRDGNRGATSPVKRDGARDKRSDGRKPATGGNRRPAAAAGAAAPVQKTPRSRYKKPQNRYQDKKKRGENRRGLERVKRNVKKREPVKKTPSFRTIEIPEAIALQDFANLIKIAPAQLIKKLFMDGKVFTLNDVLDFETAEEIGMEYHVICEKEVKVDIIKELLEEADDPAESLVERPPVVCVMGHVDHGKTSLLDAIRKTDAVAGESGGITQHIGASEIRHNGKTITFLDTPGHEAFTSMRLRGARSTDIAILVVAADDGVMPQTIEAINHAKAAEIEIIVAINKIDKPAANPDRVMSDLAEQGILVTDWGGNIECVKVSAHSGEGITDLLDTILLTAEILELKANPDRTARGLVLEAKMDPKKGKVATLLIQKGMLHVGDPIAVGISHGRVRTMKDFLGKRLEIAGPSKAVEVTGLNEVPEAGEIFVACNSEKNARRFAETYMEDAKDKMIEATKSRMSLDDLFNRIREGRLKELNLVVKADVQGSVEAIRQSLEKLSNEEVMVKIIHGAVGTITESDAILASASNAIIIGFNVRVDPVANEIIHREKIDCRMYSVIYNAIEDVQAAMKGMLEPVYEEKVIGKAIVRQTYKASGVGVIAGCYVESGVIQRNAKLRVRRNDKVIFDGNMQSLKRFKDDVKEVQKGYECGIVVMDYDDVREDDEFEAYIMVEVEREI